MTITQLEYVLALNTYRNFALAAKNCYVTQPTLSMQVKKLEEELGIILFDRSKKPVLPTDIGTKVIEQAKNSLREIEKIHEIIRNQKDELTGLLRVGIIPTISPYLLPLFISKFMTKYPEVELIFEEMLTKDISYKLNNDLLDVGIIVTPMVGSNLLEIPLFYEDFVCYMNPNHQLFSKSTLNVDDLNIDEMWLLKEGHCFRNQMMNICGQERKFRQSKLKFESGSLSTLMKIVEQQSGYTLLPQLATIELDDRKRKLIRQFNRPKPIREISIAVHRSYIKRKLISLLKETILESLPSTVLNRAHGTVVQW